MEANPLYGQTGGGESRFAVAGDLRRMYPVGAAGGLFSVEQLGQKRQSGSAFSYFAGVGGDLPSIVVTDVLGSQNMISNGSALFTLGTGANVDATVRAWRLGVTTASGGNSVTLAPINHGVIVVNGSLSINVRRTVLYAGEAIYQNTTPLTPILGASVETFITNVGGTVTTTAGSGSIQGNVTTFTTASRTGATYAGYVGTLPSKTLLQAGDLIRVRNAAGTAFSIHRITSINAATGAGALTVSPVVPAASAGVAQVYTLYRTGYDSAFSSQVVSINDGAENFYNYYAGASTLATLPGTINVFVRPVAGGTSAHFTAPQTTTAGANIADVEARDVAYYKGYLLYGWQGTIGWSVAGFPTSFTTGFGALDFPAANVSVVDNQDFFLGFEYLGDQLIALFEKSIWLVQATGTVPEFEFYRLPEPTGPHAASTGSGTRLFCSARNSVFYWTNGGLMQLTGGVAKSVSDEIFSAIQLKFGGGGAPLLVWEPTTDSVYVVGENDGTGFLYNVPTKTWSYLNTPAMDPSARFYALTGDMTPDTARMASAWYDTTDELINWHSASVGGPWYVPYVQPGIFTTNAIWATPIIGLGDEYGAFQMAGFQLDGIGGTLIINWDLYAGRTPYAMELVQSGTVDFIDNRRLLAKKQDAAFIALVFTLTGNSGGIINGVNIYPEGRGR